MAALLLLGLLLLIASAGTAAGDDAARELPHLELAVSSRGHGSAGGDDGARFPHLELPDSGRGHGSAAGLMGIMARSGCGSFGELLRATPNASDLFEERIVADGSGPTVFCPDDEAVAAFEPTFRALADRDRLAVLLLHGVAARYGRAQLAAFEWVELRTLAANESKTITIRAHNESGTLWLWPSPRPCRRCGHARIIKTVSSEEGALAVHLVDAMLTLPCPLRQKLDGEDEAGASGGYLGWLHLCIPLSPLLSGVAGAILGPLGVAWWLRTKDAVRH